MHRIAVAGDATTRKVCDAGRVWLRAVRTAVMACLDIDIVIIMGSGKASETGSPLRSMNETLYDGTIGRRIRDRE